VPNQPEQNPTYPTDFSDRVFTVATGALALSITFKSSITGSTAICSWILSLSWGFLTICIILQLIEHLHKWAKTTSLKMGDQKTAELAGEISFRAFRASTLFFAFGIISLCLFAILNNH